MGSTMESWLAEVAEQVSASTMELTPDEGDDLRQDTALHLCEIWPMIAAAKHQRAYARTAAVHYRAKWLAHRKAGVNATHSVDPHTLDVMAYSMVQPDPDHPGHRRKIGVVQTW